MVEFSGDVEYGYMMPTLALKMLVSWLSVTEMFCDVRSDSVLATIVTLRSTATPEENSTVPKNITSMTGTMTANSVAAMPLRFRASARAERRAASQMSEIDFIAVKSGLLIGLVLERRCRHQQALVARQIGDVVAEPGDEQLPWIEQSDDEDVAGAARTVLHVVVDEVAAAVDLAAQADVRERGIALDVDIEAAAIEQRGNLAADIGLELGLGVAAALRLSGHDHARGVLRDGLQHLAREEHQRRLDDGEQQREKDRRDQREFHHGGAPAAAPEAAQHIPALIGWNSGRRHRQIPSQRSSAARVSRK